LERESEAEIEFLKAHIKDYRAFSETEISVLSSIVDRIDEGRNDLK
jgi:hypothetical protein